MAAPTAQRGPVAAPRAGAAASRAAAAQRAPAARCAPAPCTIARIRVASPRSLAPAAPQLPASRLAAAAPFGAAPRPARRAAAAAMCASGTAVDADDALAAYVAEGPLAAVLGLSRESVAGTLATWRALGDRLAKQLKLDPAALTAQQRARIFHYYLPTYLWVLRKLEAHRAAHAGPGAPPALVVGISAPQGCGKTTLVGQLVQLLNAEGHGAASVSLDDFYVRGDEQDAVAATHPGNDILRFRGNAGTHDLQLASSTLDTLRGLTTPGAVASIPLYDKSLRGGRGDRAPEAAWPKVSGPLQVVCLEGWCLGFRPVSDEAAAKVHPGLPASNAALRTYAAAIESRCDAWVVVRVADPSWVFDWRSQAETEMRAAGKPGLSDEQVRDFVARFMPAYQAYLPEFYALGPTGRPGMPRLALDINSSRTLVGAE